MVFISFIDIQRQTYLQSIHTICKCIASSGSRLYSSNGACLKHEMTNGTTSNSQGGIRVSVGVTLTIIGSKLSSE